MVKSCGPLSDGSSAKAKPSLPAHLPTTPFTPLKEDGISFGTIFSKDLSKEDLSPLVGSRPSGRGEIRACLEASPADWTKQLCGEDGHLTHLLGQETPTDRWEATLN